MLLKLRTKLILFIIGGALINIFLVSTLTNMSLFREYDDYMIKEQGHRVHHLILMIEQSYRANDGWTSNTVDNIDFSPYVGDFDIKIQDSEKNVIFTKEMDNQVLRRHHDMVHRIGRNRLISIWDRNYNHTSMETLREENYTLNEYILRVDEGNIGTLTLGHVGEFTVYERDVAFTTGINSSIFYSALISVLVAFMLGIYISKKFTRPIVEMTDAANNIRLGKLDTKVNRFLNLFCSFKDSDR